MGPQAIASIANVGLQAIPLFFGENNIFSGKARRARRELDKTFAESQRMELPTEYTEAMQGLRTQANTGIPSAAMNLYQQNAARNQSSMLSGLRSRRSALGSVGQIAQAGQNAAMNLASMQANALQQAQGNLNRGLMQMGGLKYQEQLRKSNEAAQFYGSQRQEANQAVSSALKGIGGAIGAGIAYGGFEGEGDGLSGEQKDAVKAFKKMKRRGIESTGF